MAILQLKTKPYSSSSAIYDNSVFQTGRINLQGDQNGSGVGIFIESTLPLSVTGDLTQGVTYNSASLLVNGGVFIEDYLYVNSGITTNGDIQIGVTNSDTQTLTMGLPVDNKAWRMRKVDETIRWEKFNISSGEWDLMIRFSEC